jgi:hypothetical protein
MQPFTLAFKNTVHECVTNLLQSKINALLNNLASLKESGANETKSTAGDKHETALAMLQIEQANNRTQLQILLEQKASLEKIELNSSRESIGIGSLVQTNNGVFYVSIALGKITVTNQLVYSVSLDAPLGQQLLNKKTNETFTINNTEYIIENFI